MILFFYTILQFFFGGNSLFIENSPQINVLITLNRLHKFTSCIDFFPFATKNELLCGDNEQTALDHWQHKNNLFATRQLKSMGLARNYAQLRKAPPLTC
ncbi:hypothetical protein BWD42_12780 [Sphingobacterium sp. CZ-UAM]|nr:hypothetical protein BWD42_12780 [Sphingobacterium sp. CZ-UAM]